MTSYLSPSFECVKRTSYLFVTPDLLPLRGGARSKLQVQDFASSTWGSGIFAIYIEINGSRITNGHVDELAIIE